MIIYLTIQSENIPRLFNNLNKILKNPKIADTYLFKHFKEFLTGS